jgi:hypothetical protein
MTTCVKLGAAMVHTWPQTIIQVMPAATRPHVFYFPVDRMPTRMHVGAAFVSTWTQLAI